MTPILAELYYRLVVVANDMKHVHTHAKGPKFDRIHAICNEYYEKANEQSDTLVEMAIEYNQQVQNSSRAATILGYRPTNQASYGWNESLNVIHTNLQMLIETFEVAIAQGLDSDVVSQLDEYLRYWKKEANYKNRARMEDMDSNE